MLTIAAVEFVLSIVKVLACTGFIILGIIINCGGVPTDSRGYIGGEYWRSPYSAFNNGFHGFCTVFVTASFAFGGTELTGLAAAEAADPKRQIPKATKQVFWRIAFFYIVNLLIVGLIVPANNPNLLGNGAATTDASPFVIAINLAGIPALPSIFNAVITISVISVANSATYASTRTIQAMALQGMAPKFLAYVDKKGRPIPTVILQIAFGFIAFINEAKVGATVIYWLLALSGLANFFVYGSICLSHIRFRGAWRRNGHSLDELPYQAQFGVLGSWLGFALNVICLAAQFYTAIFVSASISSFLVLGLVPHASCVPALTGAPASPCISYCLQFFSTVPRFAAHPRLLLHLEDILLVQRTCPPPTLGRGRQDRHLHRHARRPAPHIRPGSAPVGAGAPCLHC